MDSQYRGSDEKVMGSSRSVRSLDVLLRILGLALTLVAAIVVGVDKETKIVPITASKSIPVTAKSQYMSAFVYFVVSNAIACSYAAVSLVFSMAAGHNRVELMLIILDLIMVGLLSSAIGAAGGIGVIGHDGNSHVKWNKVCDVFDTYCNRLAASLILSLLGSFVFLCLVVLATLNLHKKSK